MIVYLRAAARETRNGTELSERSLWAVEEAASELGAFQDVVKALPPQPTLGYSLSVVAPVKATVPRRLAEVFIASAQPDSSGEPDDHEVLIEECLSHAISDLAKMKHGDVEAASRVLSVVSDGSD